MVSDFFLTLDDDDISSFVTDVVSPSAGTDVESPSTRLDTTFLKTAKNSLFIMRTIADELVVSTFLLKRNVILTMPGCPSCYSDIHNVAIISSKYKDCSFSMAL